MTEDFHLADVPSTAGKAPHAEASSLVREEPVTVGTVSQSFRHAATGRRLMESVVGVGTRTRLRNQRGQLTTLAIMMICLAIVPAVVGHGTLAIITTDLIFLELAYAWNLVGGFVGELSLGHMVFWAIGSFGMIFALNHAWPVLPVIVGLAVVGAAVGMAMALAIRLARLEGLLYVAIFTLILAELVQNFVENWNPLGASVGIVAVRIPGIGPAGQYELILALVVVAVLVNVAVVATGRGATWRALRDDVQAAETCGIRITHQRMIAYGLSAALCVAGGAFQGYYLGSASGSVSLDVTVIITVSLAVFVGGPGTVLGPFAGWLVIYGLGSIVTSVSTSVNASLYAQIIELVAALVALRLLIQRLGHRDLFSGIANWLHRRDRNQDISLSTSILGIEVPLEHQVPSGEHPSGGAPAASSISAPGPNTVAALDVAARTSPGDKEETGTLGKRPSLASGAGQRSVGVRSAGVGSAGVADEPLVVDGVCQTFGRIQVLRGISFVVRPGEIVGLLGANGAGKSTLCNVLSGLLRPTAGTVRIGNVDLSPMDPSTRAAFGFGRSFQTPRLFASLSLQENLSVAGVASERTASALRLVPGAQDPGRMAGQAEFFARRLTEVARAASMGTQLLLLDEPLAGLTEQEHHVVLGLARRAAQAGARVLIVEHLIPAIAPFVDRLVVLGDGMVIADGPAEVVLADPEVVAAYLGQALVVGA